MAPLDLVALSFLPVGRLRLVTEQLRTGTAPRDVLVAQSAERRHRHPSAPDAARLLDLASAAIEGGRAAGLTLLTCFDPMYPPWLLATVDPPPVLWLQGSLACLDRLAVAVVGARRASPYALAVAEQLSSDLAARGVVVTSGMARGVDAAAHRGALSVHGTTIAVLGCGANVVYPPEHDLLARQIAGSGALVSEFAPGTLPKAGFFPQRNRVISGLARAVVVIEAGEKSGSLITARCALEQGRDVLAVPGNVLNGRNRGAHALLRDGARIVESADDVLEELGLAARGSTPGQGASRTGDPVTSALPLGEPCSLDEIAAESGLSPARILPRLLELELQGVVRRIGGGQFVRVDRSC